MPVYYEQVKHREAKVVLYQIAQQVQGKPSAGIGKLLRIIIERIRVSGLACLIQKRKSNLSQSDLTTGKVNSADDSTV